MGKQSRREKTNVDNKVSSGAFSDEQTEKMFNALPKEEQDKFTTMGEHMFSQLGADKDGKLVIDLNEFNKDYTEETAYVFSQIKSGLHISYLTDQEKTLMQKSFGEKWYIKWGYVEEDLCDIITTCPILL